MPRSLKSPLRPRLALGIALLLLPATVTLLAEDKPAAHPPAPVAATAPSTQKTREQRKEEEINRVMEFFKITQPDVYEQAKTLRDTDPARFEKLVRPTVSTVNHLEELRKKSPKLFDLTMKDLELAYHSLRLARQLKRSDLAAADRDRLTTELTSVVSSQFDVRQRMHQQEIEDLKAQLKQIEDNLKSNDQIKASLIKKRVDDLVDKPPRLDW